MLAGSLLGLHQYVLLMYCCQAGNQNWATMDTGGLWKASESNSVTLSILRTTRGCHLALPCLSLLPLLTEVYLAHVSMEPNHIHTRIPFNYVPQHQFCDASSLATSAHRSGPFKFATAQLSLQHQPMQSGTAATLKHVTHLQLRREVPSSGGDDLHTNSSRQLLQVVGLL